MAGLGGVIGAIGQPIAAHFAQKRQHKYIKKYMKNKWQWEVADLKAAGLNPILGITGRSPNIGSPGIPSIAGGMGATALSAMKLKKEMRLLDAAADQAQANAEERASKAVVNKETAKKVELEVKEFPIRPMGVARRLFNKEVVEKATKAVIKIPDWIKDRLKAVAER